MPTDEKKKIPVETGGHPDIPILPQTDDRAAVGCHRRCICPVYGRLPVYDPLFPFRPLDIKPEKDTTIHFKDYYDYGHSENQDTVRLVC